MVSRLLCNINEASRRDGALIIVQAMIKGFVRWMIRRNIARLNAGDATAFLKLAAEDVELAFPGDSTWAREHRPVAKGRYRHVTHRGVAECRAFAQRFVNDRIQFAVEDILVNGPPWRLRIAIRAHVFARTDGASEDVYNNRVMAFLEFRRSKLIRWEDYEDTERTAAWDRARADARPTHGV
jgi:ketosteroid isomerase-like protein